MATQRTIREGIISAVEVRRRLSEMTRSHSIFLASPPKTGVRAVAAESSKHVRSVSGRRLRRFSGS